MKSDSTDPTRSALMRDTNYRWLLSGAMITNLGDQFTLVALPWLVLQMTGDTRVLGTVLALIAVPRAIFILIGGAIVDRYSPKMVLMLTKYVNTALLGSLAFLVWREEQSLWAVYGLALGIGVSTAFSIPSGSSILPQIIAPQLLHAANGMMLGLRQLAMFAGPLLAGLLIALLGTSSAHATSDTRGLAMAFGLDALSFAVSAWTLAHVQLMERPPTAASAVPMAVLSSVGAGLRHCWNDHALRTSFLYWAAMAIFMIGPLQIAVPVLVNAQGLGAAALGMLMGSHGAGILVGMAVSGARPQWRLRTLGMTMLAADAVIGLLFMPMGLISATWQGVVLMVSIGVLNGFIQVAIFTWLQRRVPRAMMGRAMSLFMFIFMGIVPIASAVTGWLMQAVSLAHLFMLCGGGLICICTLALVFTRIRTMTEGVDTNAATAPAAAQPAPSSPLQPHRQSS